MAIQTTYTKVRSDFAKLWDAVTLKQEIIIISRRGSEDVAMISASDAPQTIEELRQEVGLDQEEA
jgi:antitoxin YefM